MNEHGETFEDSPPPGEYLTCPLHGCKYKLRRMSPQQAVQEGARLVRMASQLRTVQELVHKTLRAEAEREEGLVQEHLKTHSMIDFHNTETQLYREYREKVAKIEKLRELVFYATATEEQPEGK